MAASVFWLALAALGHAFAVVAIWSVQRYRGRLADWKVAVADWPARGWLGSVCGKLFMAR